MVIKRRGVGAEIHAEIDEQQFAQDLLRATSMSLSCCLLASLLTSSVAFVPLRSLHGPPARSRVTARALEPVAEEHSLRETETESLFALAVASNADGLLSFGDSVSYTHLTLPTKA